MRDFTLKIYVQLLQALQTQGHFFVAFNKFMEKPPKRCVILRHDVDRLPQNSLITAKLERKLGISGTYFFRMVPESFDIAIMKKISALGHEIGYHYEDVDVVSKKLKVKDEKDQERLIDLAYESFCKNLEKMRKYVDVKTICMHGSPRSKWDNKLIWSKYDYRELGILGEPYLDIDFDEFAYYTDTGRRWNGDAVSVRDKVGSRQDAVGSRQDAVGSRQDAVGSKQDVVGSKQDAVSSNEKEGGTHHRSRVTINWPRFRKTIEMIQAIEQGQFPQKAMITVHPQRWSDSLIPWIRELVWQNVKNQIKKYVVSSGE